MATAGWREAGAVVDGQLGWAAVAAQVQGVTVTEMVGWLGQAAEVARAAGRQPGQAATAEAPGAMAAAQLARRAVRVVAAAAGRQLGPGAMG